MTARSHLVFVATAFALFGAVAWADDDVTVVPVPTTAPASSQQATTADGTPVVHKHHKKKTALTQTASTTSGTSASTNGATPTSALAPGVVVTKSATPPPSLPAPRPQASVVVGPAPVTITAVLPPRPTPVTVTTPLRVPPVPTTTPIKITNVMIPVPSVTPPSVAHTQPLTPTVVETGLPVARNQGIGASIPGVSTYIPTPAPLPVKTVAGTTTHPYYASIIPASVIPLTSSATASFSPPSRTTAPPPEFVFTNFTKKATTTYPWKRDIITTMFWIGEGGSSISATDNIGSAWDEHWRSTNRGNDSPDARNGYASADHASTVNPFYVALPFNDLAYPDKAYLVPRSWHRPPVDGKQVSACKDRWVCIKNANGRLCYAQWEDVGPLRSDHAEYVFGNERPNTYTRAGLDVSPAVAKYLGIDENNRAITSWRFVDAEDVPPGAWLKYDEQAVIFTAMHQFRNAGTSDLPVQKAAEPIDDQNTDSNKKRIDQSKG
jgi:hypothetical protein